eukprot:TRINITY_DN22191_c0_g1_i2.p1 TRINITY_DN22191_c0_g1~~TRINITY_DN22191_c0_g1_i2.p1  ORF type:complete len:110 (-),score=18.84 TRINITY_DN22191_c0_g1_i2:95-424(-)
MCPSYDYSVTKNDFYRLEKALAYAFATEGKTFKRDTGQDQLSLSQKFDVRMFFCVRDVFELKNLIQKRCVKMILDGMIQEYLQFTAESMKLTDPKEHITLPLGTESESE